MSKWLNLHMTAMSPEGPFPCRSEALIPSPASLPPFSQPPTVDAGHRWVECMGTTHHVNMIRFPPAGLTVSSPEARNYMSSSESMFGVVYLRDHGILRMFRTWEQRAVFIDIGSAPGCVQWLAGWEPQQRNHDLGLFVCCMLSFVLIQNLLFP